VVLASSEDRPDGGQSIDRVAAGLRQAKARQAAEGPEVVEDGTVWAALPRFAPDPAMMARHRLVSFGRTDPACAAYDMVRTRLLFLMRQNGWRSVGITSPTNGCGKTTTSLNLGASLAQSGLRVVLVDLDLRRPAVARQLGLSPRRSMAEVLQGHCPIADAFVRCGDDLAVGGNARPLRNSGDVLLGDGVAHGVAGLRQAFRPDAVLYDLPPMLASDDVLAFLPHLDCVLLVVGAEVTRPDEVLACQEELEGHGAQVTVILNKCRYADSLHDYAYPARPR
jgi:protein-tyrosine kinase